MRRDHILCHLLAEADARIVALRDDVGQAIVDDELDLDVRIARQQLRQCRPEDRFGRMLAGRDADRAGGLVPQFA
jgi:hypothetical protein